MSHPALANHLAELDKLTPEARARVEEQRKAIRTVQGDARAVGQSEAFNFALAIAYTEYVDAVAADRKYKVPS